MIKSVYPCIWYNGNASEAAQFYCSLIPNSNIETQQEIATTFQLFGKKIMALNGGPMYKINPSISLFITCPSKEDADRLWSALVKNGNIFMNIDSYPWSERYGWLQDRFGMTWQISSSGANDGEFRILPSMLFVGDTFGKAAEAIDNYSGIFKESELLTMSKYPDGDGNSGKILYAEFSLNGTDIIAMDGPGDHANTFNEAVSFVVECEDQKEIDHYWEKLSDGGEESSCGWLKDRFGVSWQVVPRVLAEWLNDAQKAEKVSEALLKMRKIEIDKLLPG